MLLYLCALQHAYDAHPATHGFGLVDPKIHALQESVEPWLVQGMRYERDMERMMLRLSAWSSFIILVGRRGEGLSEPLRRWGHLHNFARIVEGGELAGTYDTCWHMGYQLFQLSPDTERWIWVHPIFKKAPTFSVLCGVDRIYWLCRMEGTSHDIVWGGLHQELISGLGALGSNFDGKCGCQRAGHSAV